MATNPFDKVAALRDKIDATQRKEIQGFYKEWAKQLEERAKYYDRKDTSSAPVSARYYRELKKQIEEGGNLVASQTKSKILNNMLVVSDSMVKTNNEWLKSLGFTGGSLDASFSYVPTSVVNSLITGQVYGKPGSWSLSKAIWSANQNIQKQAYEIVAQGIATQMPIAEIAKSLSAFVDPSKRLEWNGPNGVKIYGKSVDYASQRLARTLVQHTYQQSFVKMTKDNPFIEEYVWIANGPRVCPICADRDGAHFKKNKLPLDHPNGMCTIEPEITKDLEKKLADWVNAEDGTYPEIDKFAKQFGYKATSSSGVKNVATKTVTKAVNHKDWVDKYLNPDFDTLNFSSRQWIATLSSNERKAVKYYTGKGYKQMNPYLRGLTSKTTDAAKRHIDNLDKALGGARLPQETFVARGSDYNMLEALGIDLNEANKANIIGSVVEDKGFTSTGVNSRFYRDFEYYIRLPENSQAMFVAPVSEHPNEAEVLINRGAKFVVEDVIYEKNLYDVA